MTKVNINGANHQVEIDHQGGDLAYVIEKAQNLWEATKPEDKGSGPAFGYSAQVKLPVNGAQYGGGSFRHGERPVVDG